MTSAAHAGSAGVPPSVSVCRGRALRCRRQQAPVLCNDCSHLLILGSYGTLSLMIRVAIIGAGSVEFTRNVVADLCSFPELEGRVTIALHDIDPERLAYSELA